MNVNPTDARSSLDLIDSTQEAIRRSFERQSGRIVLAWGIAYLLGPLAMAAWPENGVYLLQALLGGAIAWTIYQTSRKSLVSGTSVSYFGAAWGLLFLFGAIWFPVLSPMNLADMEQRYADYSARMWGYGVSLAMFAYVVMGLWMGRIYTVLGILTTLWVLIGRFALGEGATFWVWSGLTEGGTLLGGGWYLLRKGAKA